MAVNRKSHPEAATPTSVEFLSGVTSAQRQSAETRPSAWSLLAGCGVIALLYLGFLLIPIQAEATTAQLRTVDVHFEDPFTVDWIELQATVEPSGDPATDNETQYTHLLPMVGADPVCIGFGRPDWPADKRQPTVARCVDDASLGALVGPEQIGLRRIAAGADTWHFLFFESDVGMLEAESADGQLGPDRIYIGSSFAAILVPTETTKLDLRWNLVARGPFECSLTDSPRAAPGCT